MQTVFKRAEIFALFAAIVNGSIGIFTKFALDFGAVASAVAFFKCFLAFLCLVFVCFINSNIKAQVGKLSKDWHKFALLSFLGIFCLYFFETWAFAKASITLVSFLTYAAGALTLLLSVFLGERLTGYKISAFLCILLGVGCIFLFEQGVHGSVLGIVLALLGGLGCALFILLSKSIVCTL